MMFFYTVLICLVHGRITLSHYGRTCQPFNNQQPPISIATHEDMKELTMNFCGDSVIVKKSVIYLSDSDDDLSYGPHLPSPWCMTLGIMEEHANL
jgi:hypothetical protein